MPVCRSRDFFSIVNGGQPFPHKNSYMPQVQFPALERLKGASGGTNAYKRVEIGWQFPLHVSLVPIRPTGGCTYTVNSTSPSKSINRLSNSIVLRGSILQTRRLWVRRGYSHAHL